LEISVSSQGHSFVVGSSFPFILLYIGEGERKEGKGNYGNHSEHPRVESWYLRLHLHLLLLLLLPPLF